MSQTLSEPKKTNGLNGSSSKNKPSIGLALSGGGFRATVFHLGVLKRLEEIGILDHLSIISTVSGGSITGGLYALRCAKNGDEKPGTYPVDKLIEEIRSLVKQNLRKKAFLGSVARMFQTAISFLTQRVSRMSLFSEEFDKQVYDGASIADLPNWIVINATNLATGKCWKFFNDRVGDYLVGATKKTKSINLCDAVGASAAYPLLTDPFPFRSKWEHFKPQLLDSRWMKPPQKKQDGSSRWRREFGKEKGSLRLPLIDGGVYDNLGLNSLRSMEVDYAIYSSASGSIDAYKSGSLHKDLQASTSILHDRLGSVTRQHAHEMTHGEDPTLVRKKLKKIADEIDDLHQQVNVDEISSSLELIAQNVESLADVGWPPRGPQYRAIAPIILGNTDIAENKPASYSPPYDIPDKYRGLKTSLVKKIARVRTDLDAHSPKLINLLIAQGYFATDAHLTVGMPNLIEQVTGHHDAQEVFPTWEWAHKVIRNANIKSNVTSQVLEDAARRRTFFGKDTS